MPSFGGLCNANSVGAVGEEEDEGEASGIDMIESKEAIRQLGWHWEGVSE